MTPHLLFYFALNSACCFLLQQLPLAKYSYFLVGKRPELTLTWEATEDHPSQVTQCLTIFSRVNCLIQAHPDEPLKWEVRDET